MCKYQSLYMSETGYVVCCRECGYYQVAYLSSMLTLSPNDFRVFCKKVKTLIQKCDTDYPANTKCIFVPTPTEGNYILLTRKEALQLNDILEEVDNEIKAQALLSLFNQ